MPQDPDDAASFSVTDLQSNQGQNAIAGRHVAELFRSSEKLCEVSILWSYGGSTTYNFKTQTEASLFFDDVRRAMLCV